MQAFRHVEIGEFLEEVGRLRFNTPLQRTWKKLDHQMIFDGPSADRTVCAIHDGDLDLPEDFKAPAHHVLIRGNLIVDGVVDTNVTEADEGGSFIITGNLRCMVFINHSGKTSIIGGDLFAREMLFNTFEETMLYVGRAIRTFFFLGWDTWAEFGTKAEMDYGIGYCLPHNHGDSSAAAARPDFDEAASLNRLAMSGARELSNDAMLDHLRSGKPLFR